MQCKWVHCDGCTDEGTGVSDVKKTEGLQIDAKNRITLKEDILRQVQLKLDSFRHHLEDARVVRTTTTKEVLKETVTTEH